MNPTRAVRLKDNMLVPPWHLAQHLAKLFQFVRVERADDGTADRFLLDNVHAGNGQHFSRERFGFFHEHKLSTDFCAPSPISRFNPSSAPLDPSSAPLKL